jgi:hypothetical protein
MPSLEFLQLLEDEMARQRPPPSEPTEKPPAAVQTPPPDGLRFARPEDETHYRWLAAASQAADAGEIEDLSHLTPEQIVARLIS